MLTNAKMRLLLWAEGGGKSQIQEKTSEISEKETCSWPLGQAPRNYHPYSKKKPTKSVSSQFVSSDEKQQNSVLIRPLHSGCRRQKASEAVRCVILVLVAVLAATCSSILVPSGWEGGVGAGASTARTVEVLCSQKPMLHVWDSHSQQAACSELTVPSCLERPVDSAKLTKRISIRVVHDEAIYSIVTLRNSE